MLASSKGSFGRKLAAGQIPETELDKFANDQPSIVDTIINDDTPDAPETDIDDAVVDEVDINTTIDDGHEDEPSELPHVSAQGVLKAASAGLFATADEEAVEFLIASAAAQIWNAAYRDLPTTLAETEKPLGNEYAEAIRTRFRTEYDNAVNLPIPDGYAFRPGGSGTPVVQPNLMQRHVAATVVNKRRVGNWSSPGAGKTLSALLASRSAGADLTIVCCPNSVVGTHPSEWEPAGSGWTGAIATTYPDARVATKTLNPKWRSGGGPRWLVVNYETFQQPAAEAALAELVGTQKVDMIVIDEIHYAKQRGDDPSLRRRLVSSLVAAAAEHNPELAVLGMSATPVINNLTEGRSMIELVTGVEHDDLETRASVSNAMAVHQRLVTLGSRWKPDYPMQQNETVIDVELSETTLDTVRDLGKDPHTLHVEQALLSAKLDTIAANIQPKTLIYSLYVDGIAETIAERLRTDGWTVGFYNGVDKTGLHGFLHGNVDVLIGSSSVSTGVDGLQRVANRLIIATLPWTAAEYEQLLGRLLRQGQTKETVDVIIPRTYATVNEEEWSWCSGRLDRIRWKKSLADAAVDGVVPQGQLVSPETAKKHLLGWLARLDDTGMQSIVRQPIRAQLDATPPEAAARTGAGRYGEFSAMNARWNTARSATTHDRLTDDPSEWVTYHQMYRAARATWPVVPAEYFAQQLRKMRAGKIVADFGAGEALLADAVGDHHTVHSYDHVAVDERVTVADLADVPAADAAFDVVVLSLALMGANAADYLREAHRCLDVNGLLFIAEAASRVNDRDEFSAQLRSLGFHVGDVAESDRFLFIKATRADREPDPQLRLSW